jgi:HAD superfamily hydrolase (TIGR01509 family)
MIQAMIFDLDGTLVQTERLKAQSYARAAMDLCPYSLTEAEVVEAFKDVVGLPRHEVATRLVEQFELEERASMHLEKFGVQAPWQAFVQIRLQHYSDMLADPELLRNNQWPHTRQVLHDARTEGCQTALATMSRCEQAQQVLRILELHGEFDFIATRDDVERGKPDPEIYHLVADQLNIPAQDCVVIEDSPAGVEAALNAGMWCIAVTTAFTKDRIHRQAALDEQWIVDQASDVARVVQRMIAERKG